MFSRFYVLTSCLCLISWHINR